MPAAIHHDEDFINKSLLASLDAQADAEPNNYRSSFRPRQFYQPDSYYPQFDYQDQYKHFPVQLSSQTPYGPHVPAGIPPPPAPPIPSANTGPASSSTTTTTGEEISTIFVVGFPEDMSEREFQNMFTFSPGFEAATLKIPNKEYTAYNGLLPSSSNPSAQHQRAYPTDPYSVVLDAGRDGLASWPAAQHDDLAAHHYNLSTGLPNPTPALATSSNTLNLPQRKQIIGFAKFRTREEALSARDVLQGRRVDIEKGAVLKAEMAKKNLHTKRGVGPVPGSLPPSAAGGPSNPGMQIQQQHDSSLFGPASDFTPSSLPSSSSVSQQQNSIPALSRLGWRDSVSAPLSVGSSPFAQQQIAESSASHSMLNGLSAATSTTSPAAEDDRKRDSLLTLGGLSTGLQSLSIASSAPTIGSSAHQLHMPLLSGRGARERAAADDDEQQWRRREETLRDIKDKEREKEANLMKLRAMDSVAYDAFHGVIGGGSGSPSASNFPASAAPSAGVIGPAQSATGMSRQSSSSTSLSLSTPLTASTSNTPWTPGSLPTTVPSSENGRKLDEEPAEEEKIELESTAEVNRQRAEDDDYEAPERRDFRDDQEQGELTEGRTTNINANATNPTTTNEIVGPWDRINSAGSYAAVARSSIPTAARTRTGSERSTSPPPSQPSSSFSMGQSLGMNGASSSHQHLGLHQQYSNQYGYRQTPQPLQPSSQGQSQSYQNQYQHLHMHQQQMLQQQQQQQQRERDAYMHQYQQQQQQQYRSTQSESGESNGEPSSTNPVGYVGAGAARLGMLNTNTNGNGHGTSPNPNGNGNGILPPPASSSSSSITLSRHQPAFAGNGVGGIGGASGVASAPSSGSTSSSSNNGGNTSPQLPSPTSGGSSGGSSSTTSLTSAISVGGGGTGALRGTVDQNPPINTLYVGNLPTSPPPNGYPADYLEDVLREVFSSRPGYRKLCFRHKANGPMCFVEFDDVHFAAKALAEMSGDTLRGIVKNGIRLSYSKNPLGVRTPTSAGGSNGGPTLQQQQQLIQTLHHAQYQQQQQQQGPSMMQHYSQPPPPSSASSNGQDTFHSRLADDFGGSHHPSHHHRVQLPTSILRRDSALSPTFGSSLAQAQAQPFGAPNNGNSSTNSNTLPPNGGGGGGAGYFSSPPPRFYTTSPPGMSSTPLTGTSSAFVPRASAAMANGIFGAGYSTAFSPFGVPFASGGTGGGESGFGGGHPQHIPGEQQHQQQQQQQQHQQSDD